MATAPPLFDTLLLLDNDVFTWWRNQNPRVVGAIKEYTNRLKSFPKLPTIIIFESLWGIESEIVNRGGIDPKLEEKRRRVDECTKIFGSLDFNYRAASIAAYIFARLSKSQRNQHWKDVFIAATALAHGYGVATRNSTDFELISQHLPPDTPILHLAIWKP